MELEDIACGEKNHKLNLTYNDSIEVMIAPFDDCVVLRLANEVAVSLGDNPSRSCQLLK